MRPRKVILCVDCNLQALSVLSYMLDINGYRVLTASDAVEAAHIFAEAYVELAIIADDPPELDGIELTRTFKQIRGYIPVILMYSGDPAQLYSRNSIADANLPKKRTTLAEILDRVKVMSARKRGPKKGSVRGSSKSKPVETVPGIEPIQKAQ